MASMLSSATCSKPGESSSTAVVVATTAVATVAVLSLLRLVLYPRYPQTLKGPLSHTIPKLPKAEIDKLDYSTDAFPGARDVETPYGSIRVYEWGPEDGQKVVFLHGISTSCQTLTDLAHALVGKGCRVMLFDLFGRGFSDTPTDLPHDARLYVTQTLLALASSPLAWTGKQARLRVVGYSMGGGIAIHLANAFPELVHSLVLLAPAGLIRAEKFGLLTRVVFRSGLVPERLLAEITRRRLEQPIAAGVKKKKGSEADDDAMAETEVECEPLLSHAQHHHHPQDPFDAAIAEAADPPSGEAPKPLEARVLRYVQWMVAHHPGFVPAFMSCVRYAPLVGQRDAYKKLSERPIGSTALIFGRQDEIVNAEDYRADALPLLGGEERVTWRVIGGGHDFPMTNRGEAVRALLEFWRMD